MKFHFCGLTGLPCYDNTGLSFFDLLIMHPIESHTAYPSTPRPGAEVCQCDNMHELSNKRNMAIPTAVFAVLLMLCGSIIVFSDASEATGEDLSGYGDVNEIEIAPGYSWSYTSTFPSDLEEGTVLSFAVNELNTNASITGHNLSIIIPAEFPVGSYNVVLKAEHAASEQIGYQWLRITVNEAMALSYSGCINEIVQGATQSITLSSSGGIGAVTWREVSLPQGLTLSGNIVSGIPTTIGLNTIQMQAVSDKGETKDLEIKFTVFNKIIGGSAETITSAGAYAASSAIPQTGNDLNVTWAVTSGTLPVGMTLDSSTGIVSGTYTGSEPVSVAVVLTGTAQNGPEQTATKDLTIRAEPAFSILGGNTILTYTGNSNTVSLALTASSSTSDITWSVPDLTGVTVDSGNVSVDGSAAVTAGQSVTVTATTAYGQVKTKDIIITVEDTLTITGPGSLVATAGTPASTTAFTVSGGSNNTVEITGNGGYESGLSFDSDSNVLSISYPESHAKSTVTLTATSAAGQTATIDIDVTVYSSMGFTSEPGFDGIYAYVADEA